MAYLVMGRKRLPQGQSAEGIRVTDAAMAQSCARRLQRRLGRGMRWLPNRHGNDGMPSLATPCRFRQHIHSMKGFDIAALR
ncbi:hypothetical protein thsrh120_24940 [Rhizobium sp. No.120]